jgi:hypothetical protein
MAGHRNHNPVIINRLIQGGQSPVLCLPSHGLAPGGKNRFDWSLNLYRDPDRVLFSIALEPAPQAVAEATL